MPASSLRAIILKSRRQQIFIIKLKNKIFQIIQYPFNGIFQINFCVPVPLNYTKNHFHKKKPRKTDFFIFLFFKIIQYPFNGIFHISFCVRVPLNNTKNHFHKEKNRKNRFYIFVIKWYNISLMHFASLTLEGAHP